MVKEKRGAVRFRIEFYQRANLFVPISPVNRREFSEIFHVA
jgi:hypothetical protein